ncbi:hypothetical protein Mkiyose1665_40190 [Mycobacterium kiyosense]|uniref:Uncharacterized protein n=1 Tax=Mycobacterium kiyosense TaxID=2871094 RepID=A0A9P3Q9L4_9MYCO|nr:hypothetical protein SRL2020028_29540 [Mycobacterium kiyosense]GLB88760.1 hypothetical protein SRL2020130_15770 [Mycobacterium kiyosense]GLB96381.1 hypothetical protein SRL2020226_31570 [Mycobacterium kiyosense]GLC03368.1 hypothetical protein SRL2020400_39590 [Mycobacterium kiyosense]GLC09541.1 hypothetical protein SRL2020411_41870 [Mycobacterium kiyosense]
MTARSSANRCTMFPATQQSSQEPAPARTARLHRARDRSYPYGRDPLRPATPRSRSLLPPWSRPATPGYAALAIAPTPMVATRYARLRRARDRSYTLRNG